MVKKSRGLWLWGCIIVCFALLFGKHISWAKESEQIASYLERMENILSWERTSLQLGKEDDLFLYEFLEEAGETDTDWYAFSIGTPLSSIPSMPINRHNVLSQATVE